MARSCKELDADMIRFHAHHLISTQEGIEARAALLKEILAKVSDETTELNEITHLLYSMGIYWSLYRMRDLNSVRVVACSNPLVDVTFWFHQIGVLALSEVVPSEMDNEFVIALSNPFMIFFLSNFDTSLRMEIFRFRLILLHTYRTRFSAIAKKETFYQAFGQWKASSSLKKEMGKIASQYKRRKHWIAAAIDLLEKAMEASSSSLVGQVGMLLAFDTLFDRAYLASDQAHLVELPRCRSLDKLRELISGEEG